MVDKGVLGLVLIKKRRYWPKGFPEEEILWHMQNKEVGDVGVVQGPIIGERYHIMAIKEPDYVMLMMITYGTLDHLKGSDTHQRYKGWPSWWPNDSTIVRSSGITSITDIKLTTLSYFNWEELGYRLLAWLVSCLFIGIYIGEWKVPTGVPGQRSWCGASVGFLAPVGIGDGLEHTWWIDRVWGVDRILMRARRGTLGYHELVTAPKYCVKWIVDNN